MGNEDKNIFIVILILLVVGGVLYYYSDFFTGALLPSVFQPETKSLSQYAGTLERCCGYGWLFEHPYSVSQSTEAVITDYKIIVEFRGSGQITEFRGCKENTCNGKYKSTDKYDCDIWEYSKQHKFDDCGDVGYQCVPYSRSEETITCGQVGGIGGSVKCQHLDGCIQSAVHLTCTHTCGGANVVVLQEGEGCYSEHKVYYKDNLVYETGTLNSVSRKNFREGIEILDISTADLHIDFQSDSQYFSSSYDYKDPGGGKYHTRKGCKAVINEYIFKIPPNAFIFEIDIPERQLIAGEDITAEINITNNWMDTSGRLDILVNIPYKVFGQQKQTSDTLQRFIDVKKGKNTFHFKLPTEQVTNIIYVTPTFYLLLEGNKFKGVNFYCFEQLDTKERDISTCQYISLGTLYGDQFKLDVIPPPEYNESIIISLEEKIETLKGDIDELTRTLNELELTSSEQADLINQLELNILDQSKIIDGLDLKIQEKAELINQLEISISEQTTLIQQLELTASDQAIIIQELGLTVEQQAQIITQMQTEVEEQATIVNNLKLTISQQADLIDAFNLEIDEQLIIINNLNLNLAQKEALINQLEITTEEQQLLIDQMKGSFSEQAEIIKLLNLTISEDAELIREYQLSLEAQAGIIKELELTVSEQAELINYLQLSNEEMAKLISEMELSISEQARLISELKINNVEMAEIISALKLTTEEQVELINQLKLNEADLIELVNNLKISQQEKEEIIAKLKLNIEEQQRIIQSLEEQPFSFKDIPIYIWIIGGFILLLLLIPKRR